MSINYVILGTTTGNLKTLMVGENKTAR